MSRPRLSEGELVAAIRDAVDYKSARIAGTLLRFANDNGLLIRERQASISVRIVLGPGERPATLFVVSDSGRFYSYWFDHWPRRFRQVATVYETSLRSMFGEKRVVGPQAARRGIVQLRDVGESMQSLQRLVRQTVAKVREINASGSALVPDVLIGLEGEAKRRMVLHRTREGWLRDARIALVKRDTGALACEVTGCAFDFEAAYGHLGENYAQVHHTKPLSLRGGPTETRVSDLRVVCANCHAMIHIGGKSRSLTMISQALKAARQRVGRDRR